MSDPLIKNENSVLPILIEKNFNQKIYFCFLKMRFFLKKGNPIFLIKFWQISKIIFSTSCKKFNFSFHNFWKKTIAPRHTLAQGCRLSTVLEFWKKGYLNSGIYRIIFDISSGDNFFFGVYFYQEHVKF